MMRPVVLTFETRGRWSDEANKFLEELACARARDAPPTPRFAAAIVWQRRLVRILATAAARAFAHSLTALATDLGDEPVDVAAPERCDFLGEEAMPPALSRLPMRG